MTLSKILLIGAGGAGSVFLKKAAQFPEYFPEIHLASRTLAKCKKLVASVSQKVEVSVVDADESDQVRDLIQKTSPDIVVNLALPYQDLSIMDACIKERVNYLDTANYEPPDEAKFCYKWQWDLHEAFEKAGIMGILGCGFDPGVTNIFCAYAAQQELDSVDYIDIVDCNAGDHGHAFATNFNPEINIREITQRAKFYDKGRWEECDALSRTREFDFPEIGTRQAYLMYHEELESLVKHIPGIKRARFWMTFSEEYLTHLRVLENVGLTRIDPVSFGGQDIVPIQFLKNLLPDPASLAKNYTGKTCIGSIVQGLKNGQKKSVFLYNVSDHSACYLDVGSQAISFTTGVPALIGTLMLLRGEWAGKGIFNVEQLNPLPFLDAMGKFGLPWKKTVL